MADKFEPPVKNVTASVQVGGTLGDIQVSCNPINYTLGGWGVSSGFSNSSKINNCNRDDIMIKLDPSHNNVAWNISINASDMTDGSTHYIPVSSITVNSSCDKTGNPKTWTSLNNNLQSICTNIPYNESVNVSFRLTVPNGQYNNTYNGNIWIYVDSNKATLDPKNRTWYGPSNTTVLIEKTIGIVWGYVPITFQTVASGYPGNATPENGFPSNITSTAITNIFIELYMNGTDFNCTDCASPTMFGSTNVSYSNATDLNSWPNGIRALSKTYYPSPGGDFPNWGKLNFMNRTTKNIWWNITIPAGQTAGAYEAKVYAKAVDVGQQP